MSGGSELAPTSALIVEVPEAEGLVGRWRSAHDPSAAQGVPAHVTVLFPFVPPALLDDETVARVRQVAAAVVPFEAALSGVAAVADVVWLTVEPEAPFRRLTSEATRRFPGYPPYGGRFDDVIPHLTIGQGEPATIAGLAESAGRALATHLPATFRVATLSLFVSAQGRWSRTARFPLGTATAGGEGRT